MTPLILARLVYEEFYRPLSDLGPWADLGAPIRANLILKAKRVLARV